MRALKDFQDLTARGALHGLQLYRTDPADGPVSYFTVGHGVPRSYPDLPAVRARIQELEAAGRDEVH